MTLAEQTTRRLLLAGIHPLDPALRTIRDWNHHAHQRANGGTP